jgi:hypothetical protein
VVEQTALQARLAAASAVAGAEAQARAPAANATLTAADFAQAERALAARLAEGKERPSQVLPLRRQLLEARLAGLAAQAARVRAGAEIHFLTGGLPDAP